MKAMVLHGINDFQLESVEEPVLKQEEVLVAVKAAGICGSDIPRVYQSGAYHYPLIPGHEFSGIVVKTGSVANTEWIGQRVAVFPLIPCKSCLPCQQKQYEMCRNYDYLGSRRNGGFAEYVAVPVDNLMKIPDNVSFEQAAMLEPMAVAVHAMRRIAPANSDTVAVCGLGTIGSLLFMLLKEAGVKNVLAIGNKKSQKQMVLNLGLSEEDYCNSENSTVNKWIAEKTHKKGVDIFFECVGKNETQAMAIENTAFGGQICMIGSPHTDICLKKVTYEKILRNQLTISGTWNSSYRGDETDDWHYALERISQNRIDPAQLISHRFSLQEVWKGFHIMRDKNEDYGKIMGNIE